MTANAMKSVLGLANLGSQRPVERVPTSPPRVPEILKMLVFSNFRHFSSQFAPIMLFFGATALQADFFVGERWKNVHAAVGKPPLSTLGEGECWAHKHDFVLIAFVGVGVDVGWWTSVDVPQSVDGT